MRFGNGSLARSNIQMMKSNRVMHSVGISWDTLNELANAPPEGSSQTTPTTGLFKSSGDTSSFPSSSSSSRLPLPKPQNVRQLLAMNPELMQFNTDVSQIPDNHTVTKTIYSTRTSDLVSTVNTETRDHSDP